eukprot:Sspe_Gene.32449::Locus_15905_Transcript_1_1_Confidence_1.000_Length_796::g.32449::m.32449
MPFYPPHGHMHVMMPPTAPGGSPQAMRTVFATQIEMSEESLKAVFKRYGEVSMVKDGNKAWISFATPGEASQAMALNGYTSGDQKTPLKVSFARSEMRVMK